MKVTKKEQIPNHSHYQLIVFDQIREDTGYDSSSYRNVSDIFLLSEEDLKTEILKLDRSGKNFTVQEVKRVCQVKIEANVKF